LCQAILQNICQRVNSLCFSPTAIRSLFQILSNLLHLISDYFLQSKPCQYLFSILSEDFFYVSFQTTCQWSLFDFVLFQNISQWGLFDFVLFQNISQWGLFDCLFLHHSRFLLLHRGSHRPRLGRAKVGFKFTSLFWTFKKEQNLFVFLIGSNYQIFLYFNHLYDNL
jgi:hypothetical protein